MYAAGMWSDFWILVSVLPLGGLGIITSTVTFFDNCGVLLNIGADDHYLVDLSGIQFPQGATVCHLAMRKEGKGGDGNGLVKCEVGGNSTVGEGVDLILRSYEPNQERIYNSSHWISPNEKFDPAKRLVISAVRRDPTKVTSIHVTFKVYETESAESAWSFPNYAGYILVVCALIICIGVGLARCCRRINIAEEALEVLCSLRRHLAELFSRCKAKLSAHRDHSVSSEDAAEGGRTRDRTSAGLQLGMMTSDGSLETLPSSRSSLEDYDTVSRVPSENNLNTHDSPPSYESCMGSCNRNRPVFTLSTDYPGCDCINVSFSGASDVLEDGLPPYSACANIPPPSYADSAASQQTTDRLA